MKNLIFTLFAIFLFGSLVAQVDRELVLLEIGTGTWCTYCPGAAMGADDLHENGDPVAISENHNGDPFTTPDSDARNSYYGIGGYPTAYFDGSYNSYVGGSSSQSMYSNYLPIVTARMGIQTSFTVEIGGENTSGDDYEITVRVDKVGEYDNSDLTVRFTLTESHIPYNWLGQSEVNFVNRLMEPDHNGVDIELVDEGDYEELTFSFTFDNTWDFDNCELVAFVQDDATKEVLHCNKVMMDELEEAEPTFAAGFYADETDLCEPPGVVHFYSDCIGNPIMWNWSFPGGTPETSLEEDPVVVYFNEGAYDVQLIISNGVEWDTLGLEKYITIHGLPEVSWDDVDEICEQSWEPYELTEGNPEGGVYIGEYITEGMYFHPSEAGVGMHDITYEYTDPYGCVSSELYTVEVVNCVGIGENEAVGLELFPNPSSGIINVTLTADKFEHADIQVMDALGKIVYTLEGINVQGTNTVQIDLSDEPQGLYFVSVNGEGQRITKKIFVRH